MVIVIYALAENNSIKTGEVDLLMTQFQGCKVVKGGYFANINTSLKEICWSAKVLAIPAICNVVRIMSE